MPDRIGAARLRYAMEVFADCFPPPFREVLYPMVEEMQEILGRANDSQVAEWLRIAKRVLKCGPTWDPADEENVPRSKRNRVGPEARH